jgi:membrane-bound lytic murein transglycosylase D
LVVPITAVSTSPVGQQRYTTRRADTLVTVADRFGVTVEQLRSWNHLSEGRIAAGRSLYVAEPVRLAPGVHTSRGRKTYGSSRYSAGKSHYGKSASSTASGSTHGASSAHATTNSSSKKSTKKRSR